MNDQDPSAPASRDGETSPLFNDAHDSRMPRNRTLPPRGPKTFKIQKAGTGIRVIITDWPHESIEVAGNGAKEFHLYWAELVDQTTVGGIAAGFTRATLLSPAIPASGATSRLNRGRAPETTGFYPDPKYQNGYFYCVGVAADGSQSEPGNPVKVTNGSGGTVPNDVEHFAASESGEKHGLTTLSVVSYSFRIPNEGGPIDRIQFMYLNYPNLGEFQEGESRRVTAARGATQTGKLRFPIGRRIGDGTITIAGTAVTGVGTNFLSVAAAAGGDQLEVFGVQARIFAVGSNTSMTLSSAWTGPDVAGAGDWQTIAAVTIYAVSEGLNGARRDDPENSPSVTLDFDGLLSAPIAPTLTLSSLGNAIRAVIEPAAGTELARALLYKAAGSGASFDKTILEMIHAFEIDMSNPAPFFQWDDTDFTIYERENGTVFSYYATVVNVREQESQPSSLEEATCRLDSGKEGSDPPGKMGLKNLLFNGCFGGTVGNLVSPNDASQYATFGGVTVGTDQPGRPYGTVAGHGGQAAGIGTYRGFTAWEANDGGSGAGGSAPTFENNDEVNFDPPGATKQWYLYQEVEAWDTGLGAAFVKMKKDGVCCWAIKIKKKVGGAQPDGTIGIYIDLTDNGTFRGEAPKRYRDSASDSLLFASGAAAHVNISGATLTDDWTIFYGVFKLDSSLGTVRQCRFNVAWLDGTQGNVRVKEAMVNDGEERGIFTPDMGDITISWPIPGDPAGYIGDGDGKRDGEIQVP